MTKFSRWYFFPNISENKEEKVRKQFNIDASVGVPALYYEGSGKTEKCVVITVEAIYWRNPRARDGTSYVIWSLIKEGDFEQNKSSVLFTGNLGNLALDFPTNEMATAFSSLLSQLLLIYNTSKSNALSPPATKQTIQHNQPVESSAFKNNLQSILSQRNQSDATTSPRKPPPPPDRGNKPALTSPNKFQTAPSSRPTKPAPAIPSEFTSPVEDMTFNVRFPDEFPVDVQTYKFKSSCKVTDAVEMMKKSVPNVNVNWNNYGLYINSQNIWLDDTAPLSNYKGITLLKYIELKNKNGDQERGTGDRPSSSGIDTNSVAYWKHEYDLVKLQLMETKGMVEEGAAYVEKLSNENRYLQQRVTALEEQNSFLQQTLEKEMHNRDQIILRQHAELEFLRDQVKSASKESANESASNIMQELDSILFQ